jgi:hypothetical protein
LPLPSKVFFSVIGSDRYGPILGFYLVIST